MSKGCNRNYHTIKLEGIFAIKHANADKIGARSKWVDFGSSKNRCIIPINDIVLDPIRRKGMGFSFSVRRWDQVSFFTHVSNHSGWKLSQVFPEANEAFVKLSDEPSEERLHETLPQIEWFVTLLYNRT